MPALEWHAFGNPIADDNWRTNLSALQPSAAGFGTEANGGFSDGSLDFADAPEAVIADAVDNWLMRRVIAVDRAGFIAYEGFIAEIEAKLGIYTLSRSVDSLVNSLKVSYTKAYLGTTEGAAKWVNDTASQAAYGIKEAYEDISDQGVMTVAQATNWGTTYLNTHAIPHDNTFDLGADPAQHSLRLTLWGYYTTLGWRENIIRWKAPTEIKSMVSTILTNRSKAQFIVTTDLTKLATTGTTLAYNSGGSSKPLQDYIADVVQYGDSNNRRLLFQIWEGRVPWLLARSTSPLVYARSRDPRLWSQNHAALPGYKVRAGGYAVAEDYGGSLDSYADILSDPRSTFMETTRYDALEDSLSFNQPDDTQVEILLGRQIKGRRRVKA